MRSLWFVAAVTMLGVVRAPAAVAPATHQDRDVILSLLDYPAPPPDPGLPGMPLAVRGDGDLRSQPAASAPDPPVGVLVSRARAAADRPGGVEQAEAVRALARLDWARAEPLLLTQAGGQSPRVSALALSVLYEHARQTDDAVRAQAYRERLRSIVADTGAPATARSTACDALLSAPWDGRDSWYLSLFNDPTLRYANDAPYQFRPLAAPIHDDPDRWIPEIRRLVGSANPEVHNTAVSLLVTFQLREARRDALVPLLPWLLDPGWSSADDRLRLIQSLSVIDLPESVPGLIAVLDRGDDVERSYAAESLARYRDAGAVPALKRALSREPQSDHRRRIIRALVACGGLTLDERLAALEAFASQLSTPAGQVELMDYRLDSSGKRPLPEGVAVGLYLAETAGVLDEQTIDRLVRRVTELESTRSSLARSLLRIIDRQLSRAADLDFVSRLAAGRVDGEAIRSALEKREHVQLSAEQELRRLLARGGAGSGVSAVLLADGPTLRSLLAGTDGDAQMALLASARLVREPLAIDVVASLLVTSNAQLGRAAEAYLISEDSPAARQQVLARHPGEAMLLGAREAFDPGHDSFSVFDRIEGELRREVSRGGGPAEIFALLSAGYFGGRGHIVIYVDARGARLHQMRDDGRTASRALRDDELFSIRAFVTNERADDLGPLTNGVADGIQYEYVHLTRHGGRRVFMNNPDVGRGSGSIYERLCAAFQQLTR